MVAYTQQTKKKKMLDCALKLKGRSDMVVIETCPKCGGDLLDYVLTSLPPIPCKRCMRCGWDWQGNREDIVRVPFNGSEEVYDGHYDTAGNYKYIGVVTGEHVINQGGVWDGKNE